MRTKALLLAAAFAAAGISTSMAQGGAVYSVNAVGYVNVDLVPGFNLVSNPLDAGAGNNTVAKLVSNIQGGVPTQLKVFTFDPTTGGFRTPASYFGAAIGFQPPAAANVEVLPGNGMFIFNPQAAGSTPLQLTFVGQVMQGDLVNPLPQGFSIKANQVPQAGKPDTFGLPGTAGDKIFRFNKATGQYFTPSSYFGAPINQWSPATPSIDVGEAFFLYRATSAGTWNRSFTVNNS
jgi:hypothetical protein